MKKLFYSLLILSLLLVGCASKAPQEKNSSSENKGPKVSNPRDFVLYTPSHEEVGMHINTLHYLTEIEQDPTSISDDELKEILFQWVGNDDMTSMLTEAFLLNCENKILLNRMFNLIVSSLDENQKMTPFQIALSRRVFATEETTTDSDGREITRYNFMNNTYDENINLASFTEFKPFDDEFGICIPMNNYSILSPNVKTEGTDDKWFMAGGPTNSFTVHVKETENVNSDRDSMLKAMNNDYFETRFPDTWVIYDLEKEGCLSNSGVDKYLIAYGVGPDITIPEIDCCTFITYLYREKEKKLYSVEYTMNFSVINSNYDVRDRLYNFMGFYTLLSWCD